MAFLGLNQLDPRPLAEEGVWFPVRHLRSAQPVEIDGQVLELKLAGPDSDRYRKFRQEHSRRVTRLVQGSPSGSEPDPKEVERVLQETIGMIVLDWRGFRDLDTKEPMPATRDNFDRLFREHYWIALQVDGNAGGRANFLPRSGEISLLGSASASEET
jgi:hypothetical protein